MAQNSNAPTKDAKRLVGKNYKEQIGSLAEQRIMSRRFLRDAVGDFDPENISIPRLYQIRKDPMIQMGLHYCKFPLIRAKWSIECEDPKIQAAVTEIIRNVYGSYTRTMLNMLDFGYQGAIKQFELGTLHSTYEDENGEVQPVWDDKSIQPMVLGDLLPLMPEFTTPRLENGNFAGIDSNIIGGADSDRFVPAEWSLWMVNEFEENFRSYFGFARTAYAYRYWWSYWFRFHMEDRHFEMDADPALMIQFPPGDSKHKNPDGSVTTTTNKEIALQMGNDLRGGGTIAWPSDVFFDEQGRATTTPMWSAEFLQGGENLKAFRDSNEYLDVMKLRAILVPEQSLIEGKGGTSSRNVAGTYNDIFTESLGQMAEDLDVTWNKYIIPQIVEANWGPDAPKCTKITSGFNDDDLTLTNELIKIAFNLDPNALPINFDELVKNANLPMLSAKEQEERDEEIKQMQVDQQRQAQEQADLMDPNGPGDPAPPGGSANLSLSQTKLPNSSRGILVPRSIGKPREDSGEPSRPMFLHQGGEKVKSTAPEWARKEQIRRENNIGAMSERLAHVVQDHLSTTIEQCAQMLENEGAMNSPGSKIDLAFGGRKRVKKVTGFINRFLQFFRDVTKTTNIKDRVQAEEASMAHAAGAAELSRMGMSVEKWDVASREIQKYSKDRAGRLIDGTNEVKSISDNFVEVHIRPWLDSKLKEISYEFDEGQAQALANELRSYFKDYPQWMAERLARTEARHTYNRASFMVWENAGIRKVKAFDGLGGKSGITDPTCLARNGAIMTIAEARTEDEEEHPNGTLGFVPVIEPEVFLIPVEQWDKIDKTLDMSARRSDSVYIVNTDGHILSEREVGEYLALGV